MLERLRSWLWPTARTELPHAAPPSEPDIETQLAERLLDDESLRGNLDDESWRPLQGLLLSLVKRYSANIDTTANVSASIDTGHRTFRDLGEALVFILEASPDDSQLEDAWTRLRNLLVAPVIGIPNVDATLANIRAIVADLAARRIDTPTAANALRDGLTTDAQSESSSSERES